MKGSNDLRISYNVRSGLNCCSFQLGDEQSLTPTGGKQCLIFSYRK
ncbi:hypothetical protein KL86PLE_100529 [uncultured Pleomorphomonas sp.]|uniref:Uncharacterized protein n=1 Tax=uncultured Pleomorphomonas sp. TaxID=442121 RepID=A0A212L413_9HYPH|nr:hypothetical protein KL86PLE_100529 [uncultured Pleomorphomonas sp.]